ncbi:MAG: hypothetical protein WD768_18380 [Phycisphaeraceae bacterium]
MMRTCSFAFLLLVLLSSPALAFEAVGTIQKIDHDKSVLHVNANGRDRVVPIAKDVKVLDTEGKALEAGLKAEQLKEGATVTLTIDRVGNVATITTIRLGGQPARPPRENTPQAGKETVGFKPLTEMSATDKYKGEDGGLYGSGRNDPPADHLAAAKKATAQITPLDAAGKPSAAGTIALVSISMSNATQEFSTFKQIADRDERKSSKLTIVDCAQGGQAMAEWVSPDARPWQEAMRRLEAAKVDPKQVQIVWIKLANKSPRGDLAEHGEKLKKDTLAVIHNAKEKFPNLRIAYLGSRIYAGFAGGSLNPEPYAYEGAFVARWLIQDQMKGAESLKYEGDDAKAPVLLWGPYFWGDGSTPRKADELVWKREDFAGDGVHPSTSGRQKVAAMLLKFFATDELAKSWFAAK